MALLEGLDKFCYLTFSSALLPNCFMMQANPDEFIPIFANNPRELKAFLEHMSEVQPDSKQGVYDTLLELRLQNWAHEQDPQVRPGRLLSVCGHGGPWSLSDIQKCPLGSSQIKEKLHSETILLLKSGKFQEVFDKALVLCQMHNFKDGILYLYEQHKL